MGQLWLQVDFLRFLGIPYKPGAHRQAVFSSVCDRVIVGPGFVCRKVHKLYFKTHGLKDHRIDYPDTSPRLSTPSILNRGSLQPCAKSKKNF